MLTTQFQADLPGMRFARYFVSCPLEDDLRLQLCVDGLFVIQRIEISHITAEMRS